MTLNGESTILPCEESGDVPMMQCDFVPIGDLESRDKDAIVGEEPIGPGCRIIRGLHWAGSFGLLWFGSQSTVTSTWHGLVTLVTAAVRN